MEKTVYLLYCILITASLALISCDHTKDDSDASSSAASVIVGNASSYDLAEIYMTLTSNAGWGTNYITSGVLAPGETLPVDNLQPGSYKMRAVATDPSIYLERTYYLAAGGIYTWTIYNTFIYRSMDNGSKNIIKDSELESDFEDNIE